MAVEQEADIKQCQGYRRCWRRLVMSGILAVGTVGFVLLLAKWMPKIRVKLTMKKCAAKQAQAVLVEDVYNRWTSCPIRRVFVEKELIDGLRLSEDNAMKEVLKSKTNRGGEYSLNFFEYRKLKYYWSNESESYFQIFDAQTPWQIEDHCLDENSAFVKKLIYGRNTLRVNARSYLVLFIHEILSPLYIFQIFAISVWTAGDYHMYAVCIAVLSSGAIVLSVRELSQQSKKIKNLAESSLTVKVERRLQDGIPATRDVEQSDLVPGDVVVIPREGCTVTCDAVLVSGSCVVNESMLTGESIPELKVPFQTGGSRYDAEMDRRSTLYCGTEVIYARSGKTRIVVTKTGFGTAKGQLISSIMYPKPMSLSLQKDTNLFLGLLALLAMFGFTYTIWLMVKASVHFSEVVLLSLDIVTISIPPTLPIAVLISITYAQRRLKQVNIFCTSPQRITVSGNTDVVCLDKTGTMTEEFMSVKCVVPFKEPEEQLNPVENGYMLREEDNEIRECLGVCHSLITVGKKVVGDPLEIEMVAYAGWEVDQLSEDETVTMTCKGKSATILRQLTFNSNLQRMSVVVDNGSEQLVVYVKGSPEMTATLLMDVPHNYYHVLKEYASQGYRVLSLATRNLPQENANLDRDQIEKGLKFLGFLVMENRLKLGTNTVIRDLRQADIRTVMVTGDNLETACCIAMKSGMVQGQCVTVTSRVTNGKTDVIVSPIVQEDHKNMTSFTDNHSLQEAESGCLLRSPCTDRNYAIDGVTFEHIVDNREEEAQRELLDNILTNGVIFARMYPHQKAELVSLLQSLGNTVMMCGDGANDCGALKTAHAGISLSQAEASVAAPFVTDSDISCVVTLIREGRAALSVFYSTFQFIALYSMIQFSTVCLLYYFYSNLGDAQFLYIDIGLITLIMTVIGKVGPYRRLSKHRLCRRLISPAIVASLFGQVAIQIGFQVALVALLEGQLWYKRNEMPGEEEDVNIVCSETTTLFLFTNFLYINVSVVLSRGPPFRLPLYSNRLFCGLLATIYSSSVFLVGQSIEAVDYYLELVRLPVWFRVTVLGMACGHLALSAAYDQFLQIERVKRFFAGTNKRFFKKDKTAIEGITVETVKKSLNI